MQQAEAVRQSAEADSSAGAGNGQPSASGTVPPHLAALSIYLVASALIFGQPVLRDPANAWVGVGPDPPQFMWYLVWWPFALLHWHNPVLTQAVWAPAGYNLAWASSIPAASLLISPVTFACGPIVAYNVLALLGPPAAAWAAYRLCLHLTRAVWPSVAGGFIYGFSTYESGQVLVGHLHMSLIFIPPLCAYLAILFVEQQTGARRFTVLFALALVVQFLLSTEIFATMAAMAVLALSCAALLWPPDCRPRIKRLVLMIAGSYAISAVVLAPFLYYVFAYGIPRQPIFPPAMFSADLLGPVVPGALTLASVPASRALAGTFAGGIAENGAYLGVALLLATCLVFRRGPTGRLIGVMLVLVCVAAFGPVLHVAGRPTIALAWTVAARLPLMNNVLPVRLMNYGFLAAAVALATWLATGDVSVKVRTAVALVCAISVFPRPLPQASSKNATPEFFSAGLYRDYLKPGENVLVIPYGRNGNSMLWQARTNMYFRMPGGYLNLIPPEFRRWPIVNTLFTSTPVPDAGAQLKAFLDSNGVGAVVVADGSEPLWRTLLSSLAIELRHVGGVTVYRIARSGTRIEDGATVTELEAWAAQFWFSQLRLAAREYLLRGLDLSQLNPVRLEQLGLLPHARWPADLELTLAAAPVGVSNGLWVGAAPNHTVAIGLFGSPAVVKLLLDRYARDALEVYSPYPRRFAGVRPEDDAPHFLLMTFRPAWILGRAALPDAPRLGTRANPTPAQGVSSK